MKRLFLLLGVGAMFFGCSRDAAFDRFALTKEQKLAENSILSTKITYKERVNGVANVVYLNEIEPNKYKDKEYFYIYLYLKGEDQKLTFLLNKHHPLQVTQLPAKNQFSDLVSFRAPWSQYYLVVFAHQKQDKLYLKIKNKQYTSEKLYFEKDK